MLLLALFIVSCKKEGKDQQPPQLVIEEPVSGAFFQAPDTLLVHGKVSDNEKVVRVTAVLKNEQDTKALPGVTIYPDSPFQEFFMSYPINELHLESGTYYLEVTAYDEENHKTVYIQLTVSEVPLVLEKVYTVSVIRGGMRVYTIDSTLQLKLIRQFTGDYQASAINSFDRQLYTMGTTTGDLRAIDLSTAEVRWDREAFGGAGRYFQALSYEDRTIFYSLYKGEVHGVNSSGVNTYSSSARTGNVTEHMLPVGDYLVTFERVLTAPVFQLVVYSRVGGKEVRSLTNVELPVALFSIDNSRVLLFNNITSTQQEIKVYNLSGNYFEFQKLSLSGDSIHAVAKVDPYRYLVSKGSSISLFDLTKFTISTIVENVNAHNLTYDRVNREIWAVTENSIRVFAYDGGQLLHDLPVTEDVRAVHLLYNK